MNQKRLSQSPDSNKRLRAREKTSTVGYMDDSSLHRINAKFIHQLEKLESENINEENKKLIKAFVHQLIARGVSKFRVLRYI